NVDTKDKAIIREIKRVNEIGRPILVGTTSVEHSELIHQMLNQEGIPHAVLNAKIHQSEALIVAQAGRKGAVIISTNMAGRGTDILLGGNPEGMSADLLETEMFKRGTLHQLAFKLLDEGETAAREYANNHPKLSEELVDWLLSTKKEMDAALVEIEKIQVIGYLAKKLGAAYDVEYNDVVKVLRLVHSGFSAEARDYLEGIDKDVALAEDAARQWDMYGRYQRIHEDTAQAAQFLGEMVFDKHYNARAALIRATLAGNRAEAEAISAEIPALGPEWIDRIETVMEQTQREREEVWQLGGLHVIGSERHESRRIDNQLRGRAARQGDPGSSRFFLSLEDELMRRFGGERLKSWMNKGVMSSIPEDMPLEFGVLDKMIANAQERVEGFNFDMRKNIVEYDDVMNKQRQAIYSERRKILLGEGIDYDERIDEAFASAIAELVDNYVVNYISYIQGEVSRMIQEATTEATDTLHVNSVIVRLRGLLPDVVSLDRAELNELSAKELEERLMELAYENEENGYNLVQLMQAMGRFLPLLPPIPNLGALAGRKGGQLQARENIRREYIQYVRSFFDEFVAEQVELEPEERDRIWQEAEDGLNQAFSQFSVEGLSVKNAPGRQLRFKQKGDEVLRQLLLNTLAAMEPEQLTVALEAYVKSQQEKWRKQIGDEEYRNFQRLLLLDSIDREWRDYLTAMDDLRREVGLEALGQRDPKVQYKLRSAEMFMDMRGNIEQHIVDNFFTQIASHQAFIKQQEAEVAYQTQAHDAGFQVVKRKDGKGSQLRRDMPKVGRNDPCPCGSGKKYKNCHMKQDQAKAAGKQPVNGRPKQTKQPARVSAAVKRKKKKKRRRR
ncbi:MAG: hypothetical protein HF973_00365, partial [Chloroflexi bacterium]|nr:hypothetical protein [Chloroflexota bacterium]